MTDQQAAAYVDCMYQYGPSGTLIKSINRALEGSPSATAANDKVIAAIQSSKPWGKRRDDRLGLWKGSWNPMNNNKFDDYVNTISANITDIASGGYVSGGVGDGSTGTGNSYASMGVSKFWYLGYAHNTLNNAQLDKLWVECKLRGCNLSILRGEKVPVLLIDNNHKTNLLEADNSAIDPTTMMDTWCSGWFVIGGIQYVYDPINNSNSNKWTTNIKLQRMEWPTPTDITDPSAKAARTLRYNLAKSMSTLEDFRIDEGVEIYKDNMTPNGVTTAGLDDKLLNLIKLFETNKIKYTLVSARRYPINQFGQIVKEKQPASVKLYNSYAFKCANDVKFFENPVSDHSWGQAIDIIQQQGGNFNELLGEIISSDEILIYMYKNGLILFEETSKDDIEASTSHYHIGTLTGIDKQHAATICNNWWKAVIKIRGNHIGDYNISDYIKNFKPELVTPYADSQVWSLRKAFNVDLTSVVSYSERELSYDDWISKVQATLQQLNGERNVESAAQSNTPQKDSSVNSGVDGDTFFGEGSNVVLDPENSILTAEDIGNTEVWSRYRNDCEILYTSLKNTFTNQVKTEKIEVTDSGFMSQYENLKKCLSNIKVILDNNPSDKMITLSSSGRLNKRNALQEIYSLSMSLLSEINVYRNNKTGGAFLKQDSSTGNENISGENESTQKTTLNGESGSKSSELTSQELEKIYADCNNIYHSQLNRLENVKTVRIDLDTFSVVQGDIRSGGTLKSFYDILYDGDILSGSKINTSYISIVSYGFLLGDRLGCVDRIKNKPSGKSLAKNEVIHVSIYDPDPKNPNYYWNLWCDFWKNVNGIGPEHLKKVTTPVSNTESIWKTYEEGNDPRSCMTKFEPFGIDDTYIYLWLSLTEDMDDIEMLFNPDNFEGSDFQRMYWRSFNIKG